MLYWLYQSLWLCESQETLENSERDGNARTPYLLRNLYVGQEATVRTGHGTTDWFRTGKEYVKAVCCHPGYLTYAEHITQNAALDEAQARIKIAGRDNNNLLYGDDTTLTAESQEELKNLLKVKEESEKNWLKTQHSEN